MRKRIVTIGLMALAACATGPAVVTPIASLAPASGASGFFDVTAKGSAAGLALDGGEEVVDVVALEDPLTQAEIVDKNEGRIPPSHSRLVERIRMTGAELDTARKG